MRSLWLLLVCACGSTSNATDGGGADSGVLDSSADASIELPTNVCATEHRAANADGDTVTVCDATFDSAPFVHLPSDDATTIFGAVNSRLEMIDRTGKRVLLVDGNGELLGKGVVQMGDDVPKVGPPGLRMLSNRYLFTVYRLRGAKTLTIDSNNKMVEGFRLDDARAVVTLDGKAIDERFGRGVWEGTVSKRVSSMQWNEKERVAVRVKFGATMTPTDPIAMWGYSTATLPDGKRFVVGGTIENFSAKVRAADGSCLDALAPLGTENPFDSAGLGIQRVPGMHAPGDDVLVIGGDMAGNYQAVAPWGLIRVAPPADFTDLQFFPHGTPNGYRLDLHEVKGGGGGC